jgi:hypothetical protein
VPFQKNVGNFHIQKRTIVSRPRLPSYCREFHYKTSHCPPFRFVVGKYYVSEKALDGNSVHILHCFCYNGFSSPFRVPGLLFNSVLFFTGGRTPWTSDHPVARPLPTHRTTQAQNKRIHTPNIHALIGIRTHDPSDRASEDSLCLRLSGYCVRLFHTMLKANPPLIN